MAVIRRMGIRAAIVRRQGPRCQAEGGQAEPIGAAWPTTTDELAQVSDNDAEELLPVAAFEKVIKTTITQAASPVTRVQGRDPRRHGHRLTRGAMPWEGRAPGSSPRRHASPCAWQCWRSSPIRSSAPGAEHHARWQAGLKSEPAAATLRPHRTTAKPRKQGRMLYPHPPAEYAPVTHRNAGVAGGAQINQSGPSPSGSDMSRYPRR